jgi:hypothetical protein
MPASGASLLLKRITANEIKAPNGKLLLSAQQQDLANLA